MRELADGPFQTVIGAAEIVIEIRVPIRPGAGSAYSKVHRCTGDYAVAAAGAIVWLDGDTITAVAPSIDGDVDAEVIDATGFIVIPGFIDSHRHTWETAIRGCAPNATLDDYFVDVLDTFAPLYRAEDVYSSNLAGALECINAGITTLVDWSHIQNTPEHSDAAVAGLREAGIPVESERGPYGGYRLGRGLRLPPLVFSSTEALGLVMAVLDGHHAAADLYGGYCFLNNAAVAAQHLLDTGATRVAVLDVDYHHGNGTQAIFYARPDVLTLSLHAHPR